MKKIKNIIIVAFTIMLTVFGSNPNVLLAADNTSDYFANDYCYTVRVFSGDAGTFSDGSTCKTFTFKAGTSINFDQYLQTNISMNPSEKLDGSVEESKYYPKGLRESGKDNKEAVVNNQGTGLSAFGDVNSGFYAPTIKTIYVDRDVDYVVSYALKGGDVAYVVKYVDENSGKELMPSQTFYGNEGEKAVVSFQYIEGYVPQAYNLARTLKKDSDNEFVFKYEPGDSSAYRYNDGTVTYIDNGTINEGTIDGGTTDLGTTDNGTTGNGTNNGANGNQTAGNGAMDGDLLMFDDSTARTSNGNAPATLLDLDDNSTPLADFGGLPFDYEDEAVSSLSVGQMPTAYKIGIGVLAAVAATGIGFLIYGIKKKKREEADG